MHIVDVIVGHSSTRVSGLEKGHTHKWTLFVKPANKEFEDFLDNKLIHKVKFKLHDSFAQPIRSVTKPPFRINETGFASFTAYVTIYLNLPNETPRQIPYELTLFVGDHDVQVDNQKLVIRNDVPSWYLEQIKKYAKTKKRKASMISSSNDERSPRDSKKPEVMTPAKEDFGKEIDSYKKKVTKERETPRINTEKVYNSPRRKDGKETDNKHTPTDEKVEILKSPEELTRKLNECSDPYVIYKASEYLLTLPETKLSSETLRLSFDLTRCNAGALIEVGRILKMKKSKSK